MGRDLETTRTRYVTIESIDALSNYHLYSIMLYENYSFLKEKLSNYTIIFTIFINSPYV